MATMTTNSKTRAWLPDEIGALVVQPLEAESVAVQVMGLVAVDDVRAHEYRVPIVTSDPSAAWVAEGEDIAESELGTGEDADIFHKLAGITVISSEMADDSNPDIAEQIGRGLSRDIAKKLDAAIFGTRGEDTKKPRGFADLDAATVIPAGAKWANTDPFVRAIYSARGVGSSLSAFVANPEDALELAQLKDQTGSQRPLLGTDPTQPTTAMISGVPLIASAAVTKGVVWGVPDNSRAQLIIRKDVDIKRDDSVYFGSDRVAIRAIMRVTTIFPHAAAVQKITIG